MEVGQECSDIKILHLKSVKTNIAFEVKWKDLSDT